MNVKGFGFLRVDLVLQRIMGAIYIITGVLGIVVNQFLMITMITQFFLGGWQVLSSLVLAVVRKDQIRVYYLLSVVVYFIIIVFGFFLVDQKIIPESFFLAILSFLIIPLCFAVWYYRVTLRDYENLKGVNRETNIGLGREMEDILDSEELNKG